MTFMIVEIHGKDQDWEVMTLWPFHMDMRKFNFSLEPTYKDL